MRVILLREVRGLGRAFDVKNVTDGYARNFLIPQGLAKIADDSAIRQLDKEKDSWKKKNEVVMSKLKSLADELEKESFDFELKVGKKGEAYGSVGKEDIKNAISKSIAGIDFRVDLSRPIKTIGEHSVGIELRNTEKSPIRTGEDRGVKTKIKVRVLEQQ